MAKRLLCVVLSLLMIMAVLPAGVVAEETTFDSSWTELIAGGSLESSNYYLTGDLTLTTEITISSGEDVTIDLNGHILYSTSSGRAITLSGGTLTINDSSSGGKIVNEYSGSTRYAVYCSGSSTLNINGGTISNSSSQARALYVTGSTNVTVSNGTISNSGNNGYGLYADGDTNITVNDGTFSNSGNSGSGLYVTGNANATISGGTFTNEGLNGYAVKFSGNDAEISDGTFTNTGSYGSAVSIGCNVSISGGTYESTYDTIYVKGSNSCAKIYGGTFNCSGTSQASTVCTSSNGTTYIYGGTFTSSNTNNLTNGSGSYVVEADAGSETTACYVYIYGGTFTKKAGKTDYLIFKSNCSNLYLYGGTYSVNKTNYSSAGGYGTGTLATFIDGDTYSVITNSDGTYTVSTIASLDTTWVSAYNVYNGSSLAMGFYIPTSKMTDASEYTVRITITYGGTCGSYVAGNSSYVDYTSGSEYWSTVGDEYFIEFHDIMLYQMTDEISVDIYCNGVQVCDTYTTCIREYEEQYMEYYGSGTTEYTLAYSLLGTGGAAQEQYNYNIGNRADKNLPYTISMLLSLVE